MKHRTGIAAVVPVVSVGSVFIASQEASPQFEVASVKLNKEPFSPNNFGLNYLPGRFVATGAPLNLLMSLALERGGTQIDFKGFPEWAYDARYDIVATTGGPKTQSETLAMLLRLLEDRFKLATHVETRKSPVFHLVRVRPEGSLGSDIRPSAIDCDQLQLDRIAASKAKAMEAQQKGQIPTRGGPLWQPGEPCSSSGQTTRGVSTLVLAGTTMAGLANRLRGAGPPVATGAASVIDHTGLTGPYARTLRWSRPDRRPTNAAADAPFEAPLLEAALREQLGLKLEPHEGTTKVVVIDHIERPTED